MTKRTMLSSKTKWFLQFWIRSTFGWAGVLGGTLVLAVTLALHSAEFTPYLSVSIGVLTGAVWTIWVAWLRYLAAKYAEKGRPESLEDGHE